MRKKMFALFLTAVIFALCGCENSGSISYSASDIENARQQGYGEGYSDGYSDGYSHGTESQKEEDYAELLIDGLSIRELERMVYQEYGLTPYQAFGIVDEYEYDSTHGGFTWDEYQNAIEAIYYTASIFPYDY